MLYLRAFGGGIGCRGDYVSGQLNVICLIGLRHWSKSSNYTMGTVFYHCYRPGKTLNSGRLLSQESFVHFVDLNLMRTVSTRFRFHLCSFGNLGGRPFGCLWPVISHLEDSYKRCFLERSVFIELVFSYFNRRYTCLLGKFVKVHVRP